VTKSERAAALIGFDDLLKVDIRVRRALEAEDLPEDKNLVQGEGFGRLEIKHVCVLCAQAVRAFAIQNGGAPLLRLKTQP